MAEVAKATEEIRRKNKGSAGTGRRPRSKEGAQKVVAGPRWDAYFFRR